VRGRKSDHDFDLCRSAVVPPPPGAPVRSCLCRFPLTRSPAPGTRTTCHGRPESRLHYQAALPVRFAAVGPGGGLCGPHTPRRGVRGIECLCRDLEVRMLGGADRLTAAVQKPVNVVMRRRPTPKLTAKAAGKAPGVQAHQRGARFPAWLTPPVRDAGDRHGAMQGFVSDGCAPNALRPGSSNAILGRSRG